MTLEQQVHALEVRVRKLEREASERRPVGPLKRYDHEADPETLDRICKTIKAEMEAKSTDGSANGK